jgi:hypothetical protein
MKPNKKQIAIIFFASVVIILLFIGLYIFVRSQATPPETKQVVHNIYPFTGEDSVFAEKVLSGKPVPLTATDEAAAQQVTSSKIAPTPLSGNEDVAAKRILGI